jgi:hypothetical protein
MVHRNSLVAPLDYWNMARLLCIHPIFFLNFVSFDFFGTIFLFNFNVPMQSVWYVVFRLLARLSEL